MYIGNGIAYEAGQYSPPLPRSLQKEWEPSAEADGLRLDFAPGILTDLLLHLLSNLLTYHLA